MLRIMSGKRKGIRTKHDEKANKGPAIQHVS